MTRLTRLIRRACRLLRYILLASALAALCYTRSCSHSHLLSTKAPLSRTSTTTVDFAWGSILHRLQNHPQPPPHPQTLPWRVANQFAERNLKQSPTAPTRILIVTSELAGLHKNGGIGTAFSELAQVLAREDNFEMTILVAHLEDSFAVKKVDKLRQDLSARNISLLFVSQEKQPFWPQAWTPVASMRVWRFLRQHSSSYDIIHFPDNTGIGYFSALGKYEGLALQNSRIVVGLHGADVEWAAMLNKRYPSDKYAVELGVFERKTAEMADAVVAPSRYMLEYAKQRGWRLPEAAFVIPNVVQHPASASDGTEEVQPIDELVFFGRLEERKGTRLLLNTLENLYATNPSALASIRTLTFLGRDQPDIKTRTDVSLLLGQALESVKEYTNASFSYQFLSTYDRDDALAYLQSPSRLALLPSLADNSPSTVLECISLGIRFIASNVGGLPELVHPEDQGRVLFAPLPRPFSERLVETLERLEKTPWELVRAAEETDTAAVDWVALHRWLVGERRPSASSEVANIVQEEPLVSICITHYERTHLLPQLLDSLLAQSYTNFEVILVDDGSPSPATASALAQLEAQYFSATSPPLAFLSPNLTAPFHSPRRPWTLHRYDNAYLGEARNRAASHTSPSSSFLLFLDDDDVLKPHALATLVSAARKTGAQAISTWLDEFAMDVNPLASRPLDDHGQEVELPHRRTYWFLGSSISSGLMSNSFGSGNVFVSRSAWQTSGGFSTYREVGAEDWEFWMRLAIKGVEMVTIPEELIWVRSDPARWSMKFSMDPWDAHFHATVPLLNDPRVQELDLAHSLMLLKGAVTKEATAAPFADSHVDFQLAQGWGGWHYTFEPIVDVDDPAYEAWAPSLRPETAGVAEDDAFILDRNHPRKPYMDEALQEPWISPTGGAVAAVRTFRSPKRMDVAIDLSYRAQHRCGDGTELSLLAVGGAGEQPQVLVRWRTIEDSFVEYLGDVSLRAGSTLHLVSHPLDTDDCDRVEVRLRLTPIVRNNKSWSTLAKKAAHDEEQTKKITVEKSQVKAQSWAKMASDGPAEDDVFNVALIFDRNRFPHAQSVIRSARHFLTSPKKLVFHLIAPKDIHHELQEFFADEDMSLRLYDHELCRYAVRQILPFSDAEIHVSAHCKMFLSEIITFAERVLYLDTDTTVVSDLSHCYSRPSRNPSALISMAVDMGDACQRTPDACWPIGLHWRIPSGLGLECGNVPSRHNPTKLPASCAEEGELETLQVNGGVALFELTRMKESGFVQRYVQSIVHHYRLMGGKQATWGEQDFVNSFFRLYPNDLELLPCGCNYQWFGSRREVKCGEQEVHIAHHWSHGIAQRTQDPYNVLFHHFVDYPEGAAVPPVPSLSPSLPGAPNSSEVIIEHSLNCPRQAHDCTATFSSTEYGQPVKVLSRVLSETFAADLTDMLEAQTYPKISHAVALREEVDLPELSFQQDRVELPADPADEHALLCERCGEFAADRQSCSTPPADEALHRQYFRCVCSLDDGNALVMYELEAAATQSDEDGGWILYLDDSQTLVAPESLSLLMAEVDSIDQLVLFRSNTSSGGQDSLFRQKILPRSPLDGVGFLFHSSNLDLTEWSSSSRCGRWATLSRLTSRLRLKWIDLVPVIDHPLQRHLPHAPPEDFKLSVVVLETQGRISWTALLLETLQTPELAPLVKEIVVASIDTPAGSYGIDIAVVKLDVGSGMTELASLVEGDRVLLLSDSILLDKPALTSLITFHLDAPSRLVGLFTETDETGDFTFPLALSEDEGFDIFSEPDPLVGLPSWTHLLPRTLLTSRSHLEELTSLIGSSSSSSSPEEPLHPVCHPILLSALSVRASGGLAPLRILPPSNSLVDRVHDCRQRNLPKVGYGKTAGDWAVPAELEHEDDDDDDLAYDEEGNQIVKEKEPPLYDEADFPLPPSLDECLAAVLSFLGEGEEEYLVMGDEVGVAGPLGRREGLELAGDIGEERWQRARRMEKCYQT
ncbi:hypothetical protein JCM11641_005974 [Rhodosporidiobolus odoratus]